MINAKPDCPCCAGAGVHSRQTAVDSFNEIECSCCDGTGEVDACPSCDGAAELPVVVHTDSGPMDCDRECPECDGTGHDEICRCDLDGFRSTTRPASEDFGARCADL